jgi:hypothetical protein
VPPLVFGEGGIKTRTTRRGSRYVRRDTHNYEPIVGVRRAHGWVVTLRIRAKISRTLRKRINGSFGEIVSHEIFECKLYNSGRRRHSIWQQLIPELRRTGPHRAQG